jgi:hypothetical protein
MLKTDIPYGERIKEEMDMLLCTIDMSVPQDSQCAKCCIYCDEKECEWRCQNSIKWKDEDEIAKNCIDAV